MSEAEATPEEEHEPKAETLKPKKPPRLAPEGIRTFTVVGGSFSLPWHCSALSRCGGFCSVWSPGTRRKLTLQVTALLDMPRAEWLCRSYDERAVLITRSGRPSFWPSNAEAHFRSGALKSVGVDRRHVDFVFAREEPKLR